MSRTALVDALYEAFVGSLPAALRAQARGLACALGLTPTPDVPWSAVFRDAVTLSAPLLVADATPGVGGAVIHDAVMAHVLAVIQAFAIERIEGGRIVASPELDAVLAHARVARDGAIGRVAAEDACAYDEAEDETRRAVVDERRILLSGSGIELDRYLAVSLAKRRLGVPASLALARAAGWEPRRRQILARLLDSAWLGQKLHDDVVDWEDDFGRGGAWAVTLAGGAASLPRDENGISVRGAVLRSAVLARLLHASAQRHAAARRRAQALGAARLAAWAREREATLRELARHERESPGFAGRSRALSAWARSVLG